jgi:hypothetical protein
VTRLSIDASPQNLRVGDGEVLRVTEPHPHPQS